MNALVPGDRKAPWLARLPARWKQKPLKYIASINRLALPESTPSDHPIRYIDISSVNSLGEIVNIEMMAFGTAPTRARRVARHGDTIISTVRTYLRAVAPVPEDDDALVVSTGFAVVTPGAKLHPSFLSHWLRSSLFVDEVCARSVGVSYPATNASEVGCIPVPLPPLPTQKAIAAFLDRKTAAIDALIEKKKKLLDLLAEKRTALINHAVTKGLDPTVPMKDSGIPWIGEIPAHWEVMQVRRLLRRLEQGWSPVAEDRAAEDGEWAVLKLSAVSNGVFRSDQHKVLLDGDQPRPELTLFPGDVLVTRANTPELVGDACVVKARHASLMLSDLIYRLRLNDGALPDYLSLFLISAPGRAPIVADARGSSQSMVKVSQGHIKAWPVPVPPLAEQSKIAAVTNERLGRLRGTEGVIRAHVERLQEYRQALITAAVTGQLDIAQENAV